MLLMLFPRLCWLIALDTLAPWPGTETSQKPIEQNDKDAWPAMPTSRAYASGRLRGMVSKVKSKIISRMRGPQSDPTRAYAPICPHGWVPARVYAGVWAGLAWLGLAWAVSRSVTAVRACPCTNSGRLI